MRGPGRRFRLRVDSLGEGPRWLPRKLRNRSVTETMEGNMTGISRRNLLKGAAFSAAGVAALGVAGCAPQTEATKADAALAETGEAAKHTWEV
ncbi:MAG: twin-arginine translocation signal domain-containing protein, partial [Adlercreutzia sp.]